MMDDQRRESAKAADPSRIIAALNALDVGELDVIRDKLAAARRDCLELEQAELAERLAEAASALDRADLKTYRKRIETVVSRLGHLR
jgi:hypothetical protein